MKIRAEYFMFQPLVHIMSTLQTTYISHSQCWVHCASCHWRHRGPPVVTFRNHLCYQPTFFTSCPFLKNGGSIVLDSVAGDKTTQTAMFCLISRLLLKLAFLTYKICKSNISKTFFGFYFPNSNVLIWLSFFLLFCKNLVNAESQKPLDGFSQNLKCRHV